MREIKFRAWDGEKMSDTIRLEFAHGLRLISTFDLGFDMIGDDKCELMQYTGLKDKNGKEIYEGDIVKVFDYNRGCQECIDIEDREQNMHRDECENYLCTQEIKWACGYFCDEDTGDYCPPLSDDEIQMEIIGNIYENKSLLTN